MTAPYSLRTLAAPKLRRRTAITFGILALAAVTAGLATASGNMVALGLAMIGIIGGVQGLGDIDERARELESEA